MGRCSSVIIATVRPGRSLDRTRWGRDCPPSLLYNGYHVSYPGVKWPERDINLPPPSSAEFRAPVCDRNYVTCSSTLYYGKSGVANELCEKVVWGSKIQPTFVLVYENPATWLHSLHDTLTPECECPNETRRYIQLVSSTLLLHTPTCRLLN